jgi:hypothetical protein
MTNSRQRRAAGNGSYESHCRVADGHADAAY